MRKNLVTSVVVSACLLGSAAMSFAQAVPATQPKFLHIYREQLKPNRGAEHAQWETGWPAAFEKAKGTTPYLALSAITGPQEVWYVTPYASQAAYGETTAWEEAQPGLSTELERLAKGDAEFLADANALQLVAAPELSHGAYPDLAKQRYWEITTWRLRPGHEAAFAAAAKAYKAAVGRSATGANWRAYRVVAGAPEPTYLIFSSVASFGEFDKMAADGEAAMKGATAEEMATLDKFMKERVLNLVTNRYRLDPKQSFVDAATKAKDPAFWSPKKP